ncbi:MAG TPA: hypothetical protein VF711_07465, partial [Acidimicrobiales bacterium]
MTSHPKPFVWLAALVCLAAAVASPVAAHGESAAIPDNPLADPLSKVAARVSQMADRLAHAPAATSLSSFANSLVHVDDQGRIELAFRTSSSPVPEAEAALAGLGAVAVRSLPRPGGLIQGWLPFDNIPAAAALGWVRSIAPPAYLHLSAGPSGDTVSTGVNALGAAALQARGITGSGVTVGVISDGVTSLAPAQAAGELPNVSLVGGVGTGDEGTAMLEIVHDMAPGAALVFAPAGDDSLSFVTALNALAAAKVNVIVHDVAFDIEPVFESGFVAQTIDDLSRSSGISVYSAAGNVGSSHARVPAVGTGTGPDNRAGPFTNCTKPPTNAVAVAPNGDTTFDVGSFGPPEPETTVILQWSEPSAVFAGHGGFTNLDLYVMDEGLTTCLGESDDIQANGVGDTLEAVVVQPPADQRLKIVVTVAGTSSAVAPPLLDVRWRNPVSLDTPSQASSINPNNNFTSGLPVAVGAIDAATVQLEPYSGAGPVELGSTTTCPDDGPGPCTGVAGPPLVPVGAPALSGLDNVAVSGAGGFPNPFLGTSAAVPHAGGCDALVRQAIGAATAPNVIIRDRLTASARDIAPPGPDNGNGAGLVDCAAAARISNLSVTATASPAEARAGESLTFAVNIKNDGPDDAVPFTLVDELPVGTGVTGAPASCGLNQPASGASQVVTCPQDGLASGQSRAVTLTATAGAVPEGTVALVNTVTVLSPFDNTAADNTVTSSTAFVSGAPVTEDLGGPIRGEGLARTGDNQSMMLWYALALVLAGSSLWLAGL